MTTEPQRLQYLEAMGLTAWVARYRLPNARPSEACDWPSAPSEPAPAPGERLHALLGEAEHAARQPAPESPSPSESSRRPRPTAAGRARQLLGGVPREERVGDTPSGTLSESDAPRMDPAPLRFSVQVSCLDGRWLVLLPGSAPPGEVEQRLLANLLRAAGITAEQPVAFAAFNWPLEEGLPVEAPLEEARQGFQAFIEGARRRGWAPERVLLFGRDEPLEQVLELTDSHAARLSLPAWQGPSLETLTESADAKRALWPELAGWRDAWAGPGSEDVRRD